MPRGIIALANDKIPFVTAMGWAGIRVTGDSDRGVSVYCPFGATEHPDGGMSAAMRVYPDHGYCFAEGKYFSVVSLLAEIWQVERQEAAALALEKAGFRMPSYADRFAAASSFEPEPDRDALAAALVSWCEASIPGWRNVQYDPLIATWLARCLGLLPRVRAREDCDLWLSAAKQAMTQALTTVNC